MMSLHGPFEGSISFDVFYPLGGELKRYNKLGSNTEQIVSQRGRSMQIVLNNRIQRLEVQTFTDRRSEEKHAVNHGYLFGCVVLV